jgi:hypothetical protein
VESEGVSPRAVRRERMVANSHDGCGAQAVHESRVEWMVANSRGVHLEWMGVNSRAGCGGQAVHEFCVEWMMENSRDLRLELELTRFWGYLNFHIQIPPKSGQLQVPFSCKMRVIINLKMREVSISLR